MQMGVPDVNSSYVLRPLLLMPVGVLKRKRRKMTPDPGCHEID